MARILKPEQVERLNNKSRPKRDYVQAVRCDGCNRLRRHPNSGVLSCGGCGGLRFSPTIPLEEELPLAMKLYSQEIEAVLTAFPGRAKDL